MASRRVAITGLGIISALGLDLAENWKSLSEGRSGIGPVSVPDVAGVGLKMQNGAQVRGFDPLKHFVGGKDAQLDRFAQFSVVDARAAMRDSKLALAPEMRQNGAIVCGSAVGGQAVIESGFEDLWVQGRGRVLPLTIPKTMANARATPLFL